jgi:hypothetical protein
MSLVWSWQGSDQLNLVVPKREIVQVDQGAGRTRIVRRPSEPPDANEPGPGPGSLTAS